MKLIWNVKRIMNLLGMTVLGACCAGAAETTAPLMYVGTYTGGKSKGIYLTRFDPATGSLLMLGCVSETDNPSFLTLRPDGKRLYAVNEISSFSGEKTGAVTSYAIDPANGGLSQLNQQPSAGTSPCHLTVDSAGKHVFVANYSSGTVSVLPLTEDGILEKPAQVIRHQGSSVNKQRQEGPHAHGVYLDQGNKFLVVPDLGLDRLQVYGFDAETGKLLSIAPGTKSESTNTASGDQIAPYQSVRFKGGAGPRHMALDPKEHFAYVINELNSTISVFEYAAARATFSERQTLSTLPEGFKGSSSAAEVAVHPSGKFVYGSNRGHDSIAVFSVNENNGQLTLVEFESTQGKAPRHFAIDPTGNWLLAANQDSDSIVTFRIDAKTGKLEPTGRKLEVGKPVCLLFYQPKP
jgi:6-phosphogluconolactonase